MKLGELFIELGTQGDTKELKKTLADMKTADKLSDIELKKRKALKNATDEQEKALIEKNAEQKKEIVQLESTIQKQGGLAKAMFSVVRGFIGFAGAAALAYKAMDSMISRLVAANQSMINFNRTTGISLGTLNKYAAANMAVNTGATVQGTAQSLGNLASNLYDIQMGRGDVSPYQELAFVGGKPFNPAGMSVEQVIENLRSSLKGVSDIQAANIIQRMGFSPEDLIMLRMTREEFENIQQLFMSPAEQKAVNKYGLQIRKLKLEMQLYKDRALLASMPAFIKFTQIITKLSKHLGEFESFWGKATDQLLNFVKACDGAKVAIAALVAAIALMNAPTSGILLAFTALYLIIEDIAGYFMGYDSVTGDFVNGLHRVAEALSEIEMPEWLTSLASLLNPARNQQRLAPLGYEEFRNNGFWANTDKLIKETPVGIFQQMGEWIGAGIVNALKGGLNPVPVGQPADVRNISSSTTQNNTFNIDGGAGVNERVASAWAEQNAIIAQNGVTM